MLPEPHLGPVFAHHWYLGRARPWHCWALNKFIDLIFGIEIYDCSSRWTVLAMRPLGSRSECNEVNSFSYGYKQLDLSQQSMFLWRPCKHRVGVSYKSNQLPFEGLSPLTDLCSQFAFDFQSGMTTDQCCMYPVTLFGTSQLRMVTR